MRRMDEQALRRTGGDREGPSQATPTASHRQVLTTQYLLAAGHPFGGIGRGVGT